MSKGTRTKTENKHIEIFSESGSRYESNCGEYFSDNSELVVQLPNGTTVRIYYKEHNYSTGSKKETVDVTIHDFNDTRLTIWDKVTKKQGELNCKYTGNSIYTDIKKKE